VSFKRGLKRIVSDPEIMAGEPVFAGTRIPLALIAKGVARDEIPRIIRRSAAPISISRRSTPR
jgi:uncharacterized protein (DUF433 family)